MTKDWTEEEIAILRARRADRIPVPLIAKELGRPVPATYTRARMIGSVVMDRRAWDEAEIARLVEMDTRLVPIAEIAKELDRTATSVRWKLDDIGRGGNRAKRWTMAELKRLRRAVEQDDDLGDFAEANGRAIEAVEAKARAIGIVQKKRVFWSEAAEEALRLGVDDLDAVARALDMPVEAVVSKAKRLGLVDRREAPDAMDADIRAALADGGGLSALSRRSGRTLRSLRARAFEIGILVKARSRRVDEAAATAIVAAARSGETITAAAARLGRDVRTLRSVAEAAGAEFVVARIVPAKPERVVPAKAPAAAKPAGRGFSFRAAPRRAAAPLPDMSDAIAAFMAANGSATARVDRVDETVKGLRRRGYSVVGSPADGWTVDGRVRIVDPAALDAFAAARGISVAA